MRSKDRTGLLGEDKAAEYLLQCGHHILERRWRTTTGELDLITLDGSDLVAVEVKTRRGLGYGHPFEAVSEQKLRRLQRLLLEYASQSQLRPTRSRIDVIAVMLPHTSAAHAASAEVEHLKDLP